MLLLTNWGGEKSLAVIPNGIGTNILQIVFPAVQTNPCADFKLLFSKTLKLCQVSPLKTIILKKLKFDQSKKIIFNDFLFHSLLSDKRNINFVKIEICMKTKRILNVETSCVSYQVIGDI